MQQDMGASLPATGLSPTVEPASGLAGSAASIPSAFAFGDPVWPGLAKLTEECGEVVQVIGKLMMTHGSPAHWSGNLRTMLLEEVADVEAAIVFFNRHNLTDDERRAMARRVTSKVAKFEGWHADMSADPPPPIASAIEARRAATLGAVHVSAAPKGDAQ